MYVCTSSGTIAGKFGTLVAFGGRIYALVSSLFGVQRTAQFGYVLCDWMGLLIMPCGAMLFRQ